MQLKQVTLGKTTRHRILCSTASLRLGCSLSGKSGGMLDLPLGQLEEASDGAARSITLTFNENEARGLLVIIQKRLDDLAKMRAEYPELTELKIDPTEAK